MNSHLALASTAAEIANNEVQLRQWSEAYYTAQPLVPDAQYDALWKLHQQSRADHPEIFPTDTILNQVGAAPAKTSGFKKVRHATPMLSLDNVFEQADHTCPGLDDWAQAALKACGPTVEILAEPKIDGLSLGLDYFDGNLQRAVTRGDGTTGDDVTANVLAGNLVPATLGFVAPRALTVRGEVFMDFATFERLNAELEAKGEETYANPRNAAAGALRLHDPEESARRGLRFLAHGVIGGYSSHAEAMRAVLNLGIPVVSATRVQMREDQTVHLDDAHTCLLPVDYPVDGLVFKVDDYAHRELLGFTSRAPRWATALKFVQEEVTTTLEGIIVQVGRSGVLTPKSKLTPVLIDGSTVTFATLHNEDQINRLGLRIGDTVKLRKAGAIIPEIFESVTFQERLEGAYEIRKAVTPDATPEELTLAARQQVSAQRPPFRLIDHLGGKCPSCGSTDLQQKTIEPKDSVSQVEAEARIKAVNALSQVKWFCMNQNGCPAQLAARIEHFCSRPCLDIEGIGEEASIAIAEALMSFYEPETESPPPTPFGLFTWTEYGFAGLSWTTASGGTMTFGMSRAKKAVDALERAKTLPLHRWLFALGIPTIGENTSKEISRLFKYAGDIQLACQGDGLVCLRADDCKGDDIAKYQISGRLGPDSARKLIDYVRSAAGEAAMTFLFRAGIQSDNFDPIPVASDARPLFGKSFVLTGTMSVGRDEIKALIESKGGKVGSSVSAKTDYLVAGEGGGKKGAAAAKLGVAVLDETSLRAML